MIINRLIVLDTESTGEHLALFYTNVDVCYDRYILQKGIIDTAQRQAKEAMKQPTGLQEFCHLLTVENCKLFKPRPIKMAAIDQMEQVYCP